MKFIPALIFILSLSLTHPFSANSQNWGAFFQKVDIAEYAGKKFRVEAAVKTQLTDPKAEAEIWTRIDKNDKTTGFFYNMMDKPIRSAEWKKYFIGGKIDKNAKWLVFGGLYSRKGVFFFDDFKLFIEKEKGNFEEINITNGGFEADSITDWAIKKRRDITFSITDTAAYSGKHAGMIDTRLMESVGTYGNNDSVGKFAHVNGIDIYYETYGSGAPLLLLHGNSSSIETFKAQIPELSKYYKVIAIDTRGQGRSSEDGKLYTYDLFAEDMNALLDYLHLDSVNIVGWSDGGNTGLIMAMQYPRKVKKLVTMGANIFIDNTVVDKSIFKELNKQLKEIKNDTAAWELNRVRLIHLLLTEPRHNPDDLHSISCPVLVVAGEKDVIKEAHTRLIAANIINSTLLIAPKQTHYFPEENAALFNKTVLDFLKDQQ